MPSPWIRAKPGGIDAANEVVFCELERRAAPPGCGGARNWSRVQRRFDLGVEGIASICQQYRGGQWFEALHPGGKMVSWLNRVFFPTAAVMGMMMLTGCRSDSISGNERAVVLSPSLRRIVGNDFYSTVWDRGYQLARSGDGFCAEIGWLMMDLVEWGAIRTTPNLIPTGSPETPFAQATANPRTYEVTVSTHLDRPGRPLLNPRTENEMVNSVVHEAVHLYTGFGKDRERDVVSLQSTCNTLP